MHAPRWDHLTIEVGELIEEPHILQERWPPRPGR